MIGKDKDRIIITVTKEDKSKLQAIAEKENRNLSNLINTVLKEYIKNYR